MKLMIAVKKPLAQAFRAVLDGGYVMARAILTVYTSFNKVTRIITHFKA